MKMKRNILLTGWQILWLCYDGQINGVYKNISQKVNMKVVGQMYSDGSMEIND